LAILLLGSTAPLCTGVYAREFRVAIAGFESRSDEDISFIQSALRSLLPSRISEPHRIAVIDPDQKARADFLLSGYIRKQGNTISLDAQLVHLARNSRQEPVGVFTTTPDNLIPELDLFARKVRHVITRYSQPPDPAGRQARRVPPRQQRTIEQDIPEDMPYPPMPEKKFSDRFPAQQAEEERVRESALDDTAP
jgi:hypothetical protein